MTPFKPGLIRELDDQIASGMLHCTLSVDVGITERGCLIHIYHGSGPVPDLVKKIASEVRGASLETMEDSTLAHHHAPRHWRLTLDTSHLSKSTIYDVSLHQLNHGRLKPTEFNELRGDGYAAKTLALEHGPEGQEPTHADAFYLVTGDAEEAFDAGPLALATHIAVRERDGPLRVFACHIPATAVA